DDTLSDSPTNSVQWRCLVCDSAAYAWLSNSWVCNQCGSNKFYQTNNPATRETADGVWTYMPYGSHVPPPPDGHQASTSANRRRRRRKHGDSGPGPGGDAWSERGEEETPTEDPSVIPSWHSDHHGSVDRVARTSPTTVTNQRHARKISSSADDDSTIKKLKEVLNKDDNDEPWDDRKGPSKGIRWRGGTAPSPPQWKYDATDLRAYNKFCKKVEIWMLQVAPYLSKREAALSLYNALQGEAEQELEHTPVSEIYTDDGVQVILQALKAPMEQKAIYQKRRYLNDFEHIRRYQGETMRSFVNRFRRVQRSLRSVGINIEAAYDNESMGSRLLDRSGLTHEQQRMILVATSQSLLFESVAEALTLQFPEFRGAPPISGGKDGQGKGKNKSMGSTSSSSMPSSSTSSTASSRQSSVSSVRGAPTRRAFVAAHDAGDDQQEDDEFLDTIEEEFEDDQNEPNDDQDDCEEDDGFEDDGEGANDLQELASVLTVTAKKLNNLTLGRKFFTAKQKGNSKGKGGSTRLTPEESKKVTHCTACGARGHWYKDQECPMNKGKGSSSSPKPIEKKGPQPAFKKPHSVNFIHHEHGVVDVYDNPSYGQSFDVNMVLVPSPGIPYVVNEVKFVGSETFAGLIVLDSGCQRTCCGKAPPPWLVSWQRVVSRLKNLMMMALRTILQLVNLGIMPRSALQVFPPEIHVRPSTTTCEHLQCRRYGNPHGRYAQCLTCETKWKWNPTEELWVQHGQRASSSRSQPLPPPCSATIATSLGAPKSKSRATAKIRPQPERRSPPTIRPRQSESWTTFDPTVMALDHLTEDQHYEVWQIVHQDSPLDGPHNTMAEHIFHNEETFREAREALERTADEARWTRLMELGVLTNPDDPIYDWDSVEPEVWLNRIRKADLWELFAGEAQCSYLANEYYMNALQPWDLIYGQDLMKRSLQTEAHAVLHKFRPALILMGLDCSHRLEVQGKPIRKPFTFLGNLPGLEQALQRTMTKEELDMCVPIQGSMTKPSQAYPEELCRTILAALYEELHRRQPHRFCVCLSSPFEALPVQQPTEDLSQWDPVVDYVEKSFERTAKRPYNIDPKSDMGQTIQGLFRIDAIRIQVVSSPTTRRIPNNVDEYFTRASFLCFNDDTRAVEVEDLDQVRFPRQRFDKPVRLAVFAYGHRRPLDLERVDPSSQPSTSTPTVVPNLPTDIDFPGLTSGIRQEIKASVARLHLNMGHPSREELCRLLAYEGHVPDEVYECARKLRCATCQRLKPPQAPRPSTTPKLLNGQFNDEVQGDIFYCRTLDATTFMVVGFADKATGFHQALVLPDRHANTVFEAFEQLWLRPYGIPLKVMTDPDPSFRGHFQERLQALGCLLEFCPAESHFVIGMIERRNSLLRTILEKLIDTFGINQVDQCSTALVAACHAINSGIHTHGRSAYQDKDNQNPRPDARSTLRLLALGPQRPEEAGHLGDCKKFSDHLLRDEQGPPPPDNLMVDDDTIDTNANLDINAELNENTSLTKTFPHTNKQTPNTGVIHRDPTHVHAQPCYGPASRVFQQAYWATSQRREDLRNAPGKSPDESDTTADESDDDNNTAHEGQQQEPDEQPALHQQAFGKQTYNKQLDRQDAKNKQALQQKLHSKIQSMKHQRQTQRAQDMAIHKQGLSRQEQKALDREIPWRTILAMPPAYVDKFLAAISKEANSWLEWNSVEPLSPEEAQKVLKDPLLSKRILPSRACYRDKACGIGEVQPKCRIVALGHLDPDLATLNRNAGTPSRCTEQIMYAMLVAGQNADRTMPLFLRPPQDGLISMTQHWSAPLYRVRGNVYGLADAPVTWSKEVCRRLQSLGFTQHDFDRQLYLLRKDGQIIAAIIVYVDDFLGISRSDHDLSSVHGLFKWGALNYFQENKPITFKGKELTLKRNEHQRFYLHITLKKFLEGIEFGAIAKGRLQGSPELSLDERKELRSICGCLQWAASQARPEIAATVSLSGHGEEAKITDLKQLHATLKYVKETPQYGINIMDVPFTRDSVVLGYSDSSWANARKSGSQIGVLVGLTTPSVKTTMAPFTLLDWRSARSPRVCRSTLAAEATAADECADRLAYVNLFISELMYNQAAHRVGSRLATLQAVDAKSLFDAIMSENPSLNDKRTLVSIRAIQETISSKEIRWVPTRFQFGDGLTKTDDKLLEAFRRWLNMPLAVLT
ncbi:unnamed protein product, partial [Cladocopium goreaui]